jgi:hypothetical protein
MVNQSADSKPPPESPIQSWYAPHRLVLSILWLVTTVAIVTMLWDGVRDTDRYNVVRHVLHASYVVALLWYLGRSGASTNQLPELRPLIFPRWRYGPWIPALGIAVIFALTTISNNGVGILLLLLIVGTVWILMAWRREIRLRTVIQGLALTLIAYFAGLPLLNNGFAGKTFFYLFLVLATPMYVAGGLLFDNRIAGLCRAFSWAAYCSFRLASSMPQMVRRALTSLG